MHDTSKNLRHYNQLLSKLIQCDAEIAFHQTRITSVGFPLKLSRVSQQDSQQSSAIQLADILIGGMLEHASSAVGLVEKTDYNQAVLELYGETTLIHLLPNLDFEQNQRFRKNNNSQALIDFFAQHFG